MCPHSSPPSVLNPDPVATSPMGIYEDELHLCAVVHDVGNPMARYIQYLKRLLGIIGVVEFESNTHIGLGLG